MKRIVEKGVGIMRLEFGSRPEDIHAAIGPGIQQCSLEVGEEVEDAFHTQFAYAAELFHHVQESDAVRERVSHAVHEPARARPWRSLY